METSAIISTFRQNYTVEILNRILLVTGKEFPVSGDAPLRHKRRMERHDIDTRERTC